MKTPVRCLNMNHSRMNTPIRFCPACGEVVNRNISVVCDDARHTAQRKNGSVYCMDCGKNLSVLLGNSSTRRI